MGIIGLRALHFIKEIDDEKVLNMEELNELQVNVTSEAVHIIQTEKGSSVKVHLYGKTMHEVELAAEIKDRAAAVSVRRSLIPAFESLCLDICLPEDFEKNLSMKIASGNLKIDNCSLKSFTLNTTSGKLETGKLKAETIFVNIYSGNVNIRELDTKVLELRGSSSAISIDKLIAHNARVETASGGINLKDSIGNLNVKTHSGKILISCREFENRNVSIRNISGNVILEIPGTAGFSLEAQTTSGKFMSDFSIPGMEKRQKGELEGQIGNTGNKIFVQTISGNIKLLKRL